MGVKKNRLKRGLVLALTLALVGNGMSSTMLTALAQDNEPEVTDVQDDTKKPAADQTEAEGEQKGTEAGRKKDDVKTASDGTEEDKGTEQDPEATNKGNQTTKANEDTTQDQKEIDEIGDILDLGGTETSALSISLFSLAADGKVALTSGNHEKWIDRIDVPAYAKTLYNALAEGADNDGTEDIFIDDRYYNDANAQTINDSRYNVIPITSMTGDKASIDREFQEIGKYIRAVYDAFDRDFPEVFWLTGENRIIYTGSGRQDASGNMIYQCQVYFILKGYTQRFDVRKSEYQTEAAVKSDIALRKQKVQEISGSMPSGSVYDKVTYFNEWLTKHNEYNTNVAAAMISYPAAWECMSALDGRTGTQGPVCEGYARAFKVLCDDAGIPCVLVDGYARSSADAGEAHMWNYVKVDGSWYAIDVTWNDPTGGANGAESGLENTRWSLVGSNTVIKDISLSFGESHPVQNTASKDGTSFVNGPELSMEAYIKKLVPKISFDSSEVSAIYNGGEVEISKPVVTVTDDKGSTTTITDADITYSYKASDAAEFKAGLPVNAGKYTVKASMAATNVYTAAEAEIVVNIAKAPVSLKAADQNITYGESIVTGVNGISSTALAAGDSISEIALSTDGKNVGSYSIKPSAAVIKRGAVDVTGNYDITYQNGTLTINKTTEYSDDVAAQQNVLKGSGKFIEPSFAGVGGETVKGSVSYIYNGTSMDYDTLVGILANLTVDINVSASYTFTPDANGNYTGNKTGTISFTIKDIEFTVGNEPATVNNSVEIKNDPVYGDEWSDIVKISSAITAKAGDGSDADPSHYKLSVSGIPNAGEQQFKVFYNGTVGDKKYTDAVVCEGTVNIASRTLKVSAGDYTVTKVYDGTTDVTDVTTDGKLEVEGILTKDTLVTVRGTLGVFKSPNVGTDKMAVTLTLEGDAAGNYILDKTEVDVAYTITPRPLTPTINVKGSYTYTGTAIIPAIEVVDEKVVDGQSGILNAGYYDISCNNNVNAGQATVIVSPKAGGNYTWDSVKAEFTIGKAEYAGDRSASQSTKYGNTDTYDLASLLPEGAKLGTLTVTDDNNIFAVQPSVNGNILSYQLAADRDKIRQSAAITVHVAETLNYDPFDITITITVSDKLSQDGFKFDVTEVEKTYGDGDFVVAAMNAADGSTVTYKSSEPAVASVDESGKVHILRKGTATITATASETNDYLSKSVTCTLTVSPKALTWDVSGLHAVDKQGTVDDGTKKASLYGELRVSGIVSADMGKVSFICPAKGENAKLTGTYADTKPGTQKVTLQWSGEPVVLTGTDVENYTLPDKLPEITGRINAVSEQFNVPESTDTVKYKLEVENGISQVPDELKNNLDLDTPVKIEEKMKYEIRAKLKEESNKNSVEVYDVVLMVKDGENDWVVATEANFPKDGITVTLPYPEGTGKDTHNFEVAHMFTHTWNGRTAGEIEYPTASKTNEGIQFKVTSLSPIAIGWKEIKADNAGANGNTNGANNTNSTTQNKNRSPQTGDENTIMLYVLLMMLGAAGAGFTMKRKSIRE